MHTADMLMGGACLCKQHLFGREVSVTQHVCNSQPLLGLQLQAGIFTSADKTGAADLNHENLHSGFFFFFFLAEVNAHCLMKKVSPYIFSPFILVVELEKSAGNEGFYTVS